MQQRFSQKCRYVGLCVLLCLIAGLFAPPVQAMPTNVIEGQAWIDENCNGVRESAEPPLLMQSVYLFAAGEDGIPSTRDDQVIEQASSYTSGTYVFNLGTTDVLYRLTILTRDQTLGLVPAPYRVGDDRTIDNDLHAPDPTDPSYWTTDGFLLDANTTIRDIDMGFCRVPLKQVYLPLVQQH